MNQQATSIQLEKAFLKDFLKGFQALIHIMEISVKMNNTDQPINNVFI